MLTHPENSPLLDPAEIDRLLATLSGVVRARVRLSHQGDDLDEIHILSDGAVTPKQIVRNVETLLKTAFDLEIDHRVVSIAVVREGAEVEGGEAPVELKAPAPMRAPAAAEAVSPRLAFRSLRLVQEEGSRCTAQVELELGEMIFAGGHRDADTPRARAASSARAVIDALEFLTEKEIALSLSGLESVSLFQSEIVIAVVEGRWRRENVRLVGAAVAGGDANEAAVRAVLDAVNRFIGRPNVIQAPPRP